MDMITLFGLIIAFVGIVAGQLLEGGHLSSIVQGTAALIVFAGTAGAVLVGTTKRDLKTGLHLLRTAFNDPPPDEKEAILVQLIEAAQVARKESILSLEQRIAQFRHPFMQNVFRFVIDGVDPTTLRDLFEAEIDLEEEGLMAGAKIWIDAGGYAPTIGIIGAVLGLIHVMENLSDTAKLGEGIAVAFVATIYGVSSANILFLPLGAKIRRKIKERLEVKQMILEGAVGIISGMNPFIIEERMRGYIHSDKKVERNGKKA